jgi:hypothetical protein
MSKELTRFLNATSKAWFDRHALRIVKERQEFVRRFFPGTNAETSVERTQVQPKRQDAGLTDR